MQDSRPPILQTAAFRPCNRDGIPVGAAAHFVRALHAPSHWSNRCGYRQGNTRLTRQCKAVDNRQCRPET